MKIEEYKKQIVFPLREVSLVFLLKPGHILLAMKKRGFGVGYWNGVGGKVKFGETVEESAVRETKEEIEIKVLDLKKVAVLHFYFPYIEADKNWNQKVVVFFTDKWEGSPVETEEMLPQWFALKDIPYQKMWSDDKIWLPEVLKGKKVEAEFSFDENKQVEDQIIVLSPFPSNK